MTSITSSQRVFTRGEASPGLQNRSDLQQTKAMLAKAENIICSPLGSIQRRPGFEVKQQFNISGNNAVVRRRDFVHKSSNDKEDQYLLIISFAGTTTAVDTGNDNIADLNEISFTTAPITTLTVLNYDLTTVKANVTLNLDITKYNSAFWRDCDMKSVGDTVIIALNKVPTLRILRQSDTDWSIEELAVDPPYDVFVRDVDLSIDNDGADLIVGDTVTVTATKDYFNKDHLKTLRFNTHQNPTQNNSFVYVKLTSVTDAVTAIGEITAGPRPDQIESFDASGLVVLTGSNNPHTIYEVPVDDTVATARRDINITGANDVITIGYDSTARKTYIIDISAGNDPQLYEINIQSSLPTQRIFKRRISVSQAGTRQDFRASKGGLKMFAGRGSDNNKIYLLDFNNRIWAIDADVEGATPSTPDTGKEEGVLLHQITDSDTGGIKALASTAAMTNNKDLYLLGLRGNTYTAYKTDLFTRTTTSVGSFTTLGPTHVIEAVTAIDENTLAMVAIKKIDGSYDYWTLNLNDIGNPVNNGTITGLLNSPTLEDITYQSGLTRIKEEFKEMFTVPDKVKPGLWTEQAWSDEHGYPNTYELHENRLVAAGSLAQPQTIWGSVQDDYLNFTNGPNDTDAYIKTFPSDRQDLIVNMVSRRDLHVFGQQQTYVVAAPDGSSLNPTVGQLIRQNEFGASRLKPAQYRQNIVYMTSDGKRFQNIRYERDVFSYDVSDLSLTSSGKLDNPVSIAILDNWRSVDDIGNTPHTLILCVNSTGNIICLTLEDKQNVAAWTEWTTGDRPGIDGFLSINEIAGSLAVATVRRGQVYYELMESSSNIYMDHWARIGDRSVSSLLTGNNSRTFLNSANNLISSASGAALIGYQPVTYVIESLELIFNRDNDQLEFTGTWKNLQQLYLDMMLYGYVNVEVISNQQLYNGAPTTYTNQIHVTPGFNSQANESNLPVNQLIYLSATGTEHKLRLSSDHPSPFRLLGWKVIGTSS